MKTNSVRFDGESNGFECCYTHFVPSSTTMSHPPHWMILNLISRYTTVTSTDGLLVCALELFSVNL